ESVMYFGPGASFPSDNIDLYWWGSEKVKGRHGGKANIGWADGHAKLQTVAQPVYENPDMFMGTVSDMKKAFAGLIIKNAPKTVAVTDDGCGYGNIEDFFFYLPSKGTYRSSS